MPGKKSDHVHQSLAQLHKISEALLKADKEEKVAQKALEKSGKASEAKHLKLKNAFLEARVELYNKSTQIQNDLLSSGATKPADTSKESILALAKELKLGTTLRSQRASLAQTKSCWTPCTECVTSCTECVTSCGLSGGSLNPHGDLCGIDSFVSSTCRPKPDIGEQG
jgi:hypothetical protein